MSRAPRVPDVVPDTVHDAMVQRLTPVERLRRAIALSETVRALTLAGAVAVVGADDARAVRRRFVAQMYGDDLATWFAERSGR
jgi:hypothetical protein